MPTTHHTPPAHHSLPTVVTAPGAPLPLTYEFQPDTPISQQLQQQANLLRGGSLEGAFLVIEKEHHGAPTGQMQETYIVSGSHNTRELQVTHEEVGKKRLRSHHGGGHSFRGDIKPAVSFTDHESVTVDVYNRDMQLSRVETYTLEDFYKLVDGAHQRPGNDHQQFTTLEWKDDYHPEKPLPVGRSINIDVSNPKKPAIEAFWEAQEEAGAPTLAGLTSRGLSAEPGDLETTIVRDEVVTNRSVTGWKRERILVLQHRDQLGAEVGREPVTMAEFERRLAVTIDKMSETKRTYLGAHFNAQPPEPPTSPEDRADQSHVIQNIALHTTKHLTDLSNEERVAAWLLSPAAHVDMVAGDPAESNKLKREITQKVVESDTDKRFMHGLSTLISERGLAEVTDMGLQLYDRLVQQFDRIGLDTSGVINESWGLEMLAAQRAAQNDPGFGATEFWEGNMNINEAFGNTPHAQKHQQKIIDYWVGNIFMSVAFIEEKLPPQKGYVDSEGRVTYQETPIPNTVTKLNEDVVSLLPPTLKTKLQPQLIKFMDHKDGETFETTGKLLRRSLGVRP
jgi:hypothetical protein